MERPLRALIIENIEDDALLVADCLEQAGFKLQYDRVDTPERTRAKLRDEKWDVILSDYWMPSFTALDVLRIYCELELDTPLLIISGTVGEDAAVEAMRMGAHDYLLKDKLTRLPAAVERELREAENRRMRRAAEAEREAQSSELARRAEELYRYNRILERFAFVAAHDLREPLRTVKIYSQLLLRRHSEQLSGDAAEIAGVIQSEVTRMELLIDGLVVYSQAGTSAAAPRRMTDATEIVRDIFARREEEIARTGARVSIGQLPFVNIAPEQIRTVFDCLIDNALKFRNPSQPPEIGISAADGTDRIEFCVSDNGIGIAAGHQEQIFLIFRRLHRDRYPGTGVGLALARRIVEENQGRLWVESQPGKGSKFRFTVPAIESAAAG
jgi:light-regulated signal transduction histidine kinase (bacteriophytochrome)